MQISLAGSEVFLLCSYPRTANTWVRYAIETMFSSPTIGPGGGFHRGSLPYNNYKELLKLVDREFNLPIRKSGLNRDKVLIKVHYLSWIKNRDMPTILILRDYKECIPSHVSRGGFSGNFLETLRFILGSESYYFENIRLFDSLCKRKLVLYYEDIVKYPKREFLKIATFLDVDSQNVGQFVDNIAEHKKQVLSFYKEIGKTTSITSGNHLNHFASEWTEDQIKIVDSSVKYYYPDIYKKYLYRYMKNN